MRRILRIGLLAASLLGVVSTVAPTPAEATTYGSLVVRGVATVSAHGIAYPLVNSDGSGIDSTKTPDHFSNSALVHFASQTAVGAAENVNKSGKQPVEAGEAVVVADGVVHGYCGLSEGTVHGTASVGSQHWSFSLSWVAVGGELVFTGHIHKHGTTHSGWLSGIINAVPNTADGSTCANKGAKNFLVQGVVSFFTQSTPSSLPHLTLVHTSTSLPG